MIVLDVAQGSHNWRVARLGIPTASQFARVISKRADTRQRYHLQLLSEWAIGQSASVPATGFMERGNAMEDEARRWANFDGGYKIERVGFVLRDDRMVGASPDGLIGADGMVEIKCYALDNHIAALLEDDEDHKPQVQGNLWLTGRRWCDRVYYNPVLPSKRVRIHRDEPYIREMEAAVNRFVADLLRDRQRLLDMGVEPVAPLTEAENRAAILETATAWPEGLG